MTPGHRGGRARVVACACCGGSLGGDGIPVRDGQVCGRRCLRRHLEAPDGDRRGVTINRTQR